MEPITATTNTTTSANTASSTAALTADFETFLKLLTAQMQHQDPLNPADSTEFTAQLASFSAVEQQIRTNDLLEGLNSGFATMTMGDLGGWIGMQARTEGPVMFEGAPVTIYPEPHALADRLELIVRDSAGEVVQRTAIPLSSDPYEWSGMDASGVATLPDGTYDLSVQSWSGESMLQEAGAQSYALVEEASLVDGAVWLTLQGGGQVAATDVHALRRPS